MSLRLKISAVSFIFLIGGLSCYSQENLIARIVVKNGAHQRIDSPVYTSLDDLVITGNIGLFEINGDKGEKIPAQFNKLTNTLYWILSGKTAKYAERNFEIWTASPITSDRIIIDKDDKKLSLTWKDNELLRYNSYPVDLPEGVDSAYTRGAFIHPLKTLSGTTLTRIQPEDHYHHVGIWNPWTKTTFQEREIDFWNLLKKQGTVRFRNLESTQEGKVFCQFIVNQEHIDLSAPGGELVAINEKWDVTVYQPGKNPFYIVDFNSILECVTDSSIVLNQYRYGGGIGFRATELWNKNNCGVLTSEGKTRLDGDATHAKWCNVFGTIENTTSGILFMCNPKNFEFPQPMRIWPESANNGNGDMYFQFCPIRHNDWFLEPGRQYFQRYRLVVYDGNITPEMAEQLWLDYANQPEIFLQKAK